MKLFYERRIEDLFNGTNASIRAYINNMSDDSLLQSPTEKLALQIESSFKISPNLTLKTDEKTVTVSMVDVPVGHLSPERRMFATASHYSMAAVDYTFNWTGNIELWNCQPQKHFNWSINADVSSKSITFRIQTQYGNPNLNDDTEREVKRIAQENISKINQIAEFIKAECETYNNGIYAACVSYIEGRKTEIKRQKEQSNRLASF